MLDRLRAADRRIVGLKQTIKAIEQERAEAVFLAEDSDLYLAQKVMEHCRNYGVDITKVDTMDELGKVCGIKVGAATAAILKDLK